MKHEHLPVLRDAGANKMTGPELKFSLNRILAVMKSLFVFGPTGAIRVHGQYFM